jgi:hypothetical protein
VSTDQDGAALYRQFADLADRCLKAGVSPGNLHEAITVKVAEKMLSEVLDRIEKKATR